MPNNNNSGSAPGGRIDTAALLARVDIVAVIDAYVPLTKNGAEYEACCPFHNEATPSFKVSQVKQFYHCFGCGANGDALKFLMEHQGLSFVGAAQQLGGDVLPAADAAPRATPTRSAVSSRSSASCSAARASRTPPSAP